MIKATKEYILWVNNSDDGYVPTEFDTIEEALLADKYTSDWYVTKSINDITAYAKFSTPEE